MSRCEHHLHDDAPLFDGTAEPGAPHLGTAEDRTGLVSPGRRVQPRFDCRQPLVIAPVAQSRPGFSGGRCRDLSIQGMQLVTDMTLQAGQAVRVKLKAPPRMVEMQGHVVWSTPTAACMGRSDGDDGAPAERYRAGIHFVEVDADDRAYLSQFLFDLATEAAAANDASYGA